MPDFINAFCFGMPLLIAPKTVITIKSKWGISEPISSSCIFVVNSSAILQR